MCLIYALWTVTMIIAMRPTDNNPTFANLWFSTLDTHYNHLNMGTQTLFPDILVYLVGVRYGHWCFSHSSGSDFRMPPRFHQG